MQSSNGNCFLPVSAKVHFWIEGTDGVPVTCSVSLDRSRPTCSLFIRQNWPEIERHIACLSSPYPNSLCPYDIYLWPIRPSPHCAIRTSPTRLCLGIRLLRVCPLAQRVGHSPPPLIAHQQSLTSELLFYQSPARPSSCDSKLSLVHYL